MKENYEKVLLVQRPNFGYKAPEGFTRAEYDTFISVVYKKFRYDVYHKIIAQTKGEREATNDEMKDAINSSNLKDLKEKFFTTLGFKPTIEGEPIHMTIVKAYLTHIEDDAWYDSIKKR